jgi:DUF2075 family protein
MRLYIIFSNSMPNISIYLTEEQQQKLDILINKGQQTGQKANRSILIGSLIEQEIIRSELADMVIDAVEVDSLNFGWNEEEQKCQIIDMEQSG